MQTPSTRSHRNLIAAASLVVGPLLMSIGDLLHPAESMDAAEQAAIIIDRPEPWYAAHLLLLIGLLVLIPGILALSRLTTEQSPMAGYTARILVLVGVGGLAGVFLSEMLIGRFVSDGADLSATAALLETLQTVWVLGPALAAIAAFFGGVAVMSATLTMTAGRLRWPAVVFGVGALLILAEIITSEVQLSQAGNILILVASVAFAWQVMGSDQSV